MASKIVWMISGNKGGVGKSLFCLALASALDMLKKPYAVLDGDGRNGDVFSVFSEKCPTRQGDFRELRPESHNCPFDQPYEDMLHRLLRGSNHLIINTPDGADRILLKWFDVTLKHTELNNYQFKFIYLLSDRPDGLDMLNELIERFQFLYPIRNLYFGKENSFSKFNDDFFPKFYKIINFPKLRKEEVTMLFEKSTYPFEAINLKKLECGTYKLPLLVRARLMSWQTKVNHAIADMISNEEDSNVKMSKLV